MVLDSTSVLKYIRNTETRFRTYVANRLATIHSGSSASQWNYVPTEQNPADDVSRGLSGPAILESKCWLSGPEFLWHNDESWPEQPTLTFADMESDEEIKRSCKSNALQTNPAAPVLEGIMKRFSSWYKLKKCIAWVLRYKRILLEACRSRSKAKVSSDVNRKPPSPLNVQEMENAQKEVLKYVQRQHFQEEVAHLARGSEVKKSSALARLSPMLMDGLLIVGGRLRHASIPDEAKHQIILPKDSLVTNLIIRHYHHESGHSGRGYVLSLVRRKFWVIKGNSAVRKVLSQCFQCRRLQAKPMSQNMADLPVDRITPDEPPFTSVGVDFFGPFLIKRGRTEIKRYGCIFTCLTIRAVHIEVTHSLDTDSFISALRRFIARRGNPKLLRSDNGGNFVGSEKELREAIQDWNQQCIH